MRPQPYNAGLHRIAVLTAVATFPLLFMGGLVTSHQAGLAVPDWPNSFGYNMFLFPPRLWVGGIFFEHTHRLMGSLVGMIAIALCVQAWRTNKASGQGKLATVVLAAICVQGLLGGLRVDLVNIYLAMVHGCMGQVCFCLTALIAVTTSRWWTAPRDASGLDEAARGKRLVLAGELTILCVFCQLIIGAIMRHEGAGLAVPTLPLVYGKFLPPTTGEELSRINSIRAWDWHLPAVTLWQIWIHYAHRVGALVVSLAVIGLSLHVYLFHRGQRALTRPAGILLALLAVQLVLGLATVYYGKPADVASAHVAVGALVLMTSFVLTVRAARLYWPRSEAAAMNVSPVELSAA